MLKMRLLKLQCEWENCSAKGPSSWIHTYSLCHIRFSNFYKKNVLTVQPIGEIFVGDNASGIEKCDENGKIGVEGHPLQHIIINHLMMYECTTILKPLKTFTTTWTITTICSFHKIKCFSTRFTK